MKPTIPFGLFTAKSVRRTAAALLLSLTVLSACGSSDSEADVAQSADASQDIVVTTEAPATTEPAQTTNVPELEEADSAFPVTITNRLGDVVIDSAPVRIVALGTNDIDVVFALGLQPVGVAANFATGGLAPWLENDYSADGVEILAISPEMPLEKIAALRPDVILASPLPTIDANYELLNEIAPVVADTSGVLADSWQDRTLKIGLALGMLTEAQAVVDQGESALADVAAQNPHLAGKTYTLAWAQSADAIAVMAADDITSELFGQLGLTIPEAVTDLVVNESGGAGTGAAALSLETMEALDADLMIVAFGNAELQDTFESNGIFALIPAVAEGRFMPVDVPTIAAFRVPSALSIGWMFEQLAPLFESVK